MVATDARRAGTLPFDRPRPWHRGYFATREGTRYRGGVRTIAAANQARGGSNRGSGVLIRIQNRERVLRPASTRRSSCCPVLRSVPLQDRVPIIVGPQEGLSACGLRTHRLSPS